MRLTLVLFACLFFIISCGGSSRQADASDDETENVRGEDDRSQDAKGNDTQRSIGKLYLRTQMVSYPNSYQIIQWIFLGDDGTIVYDPVHGVNPVDYNAERSDNINNVGKYELSGNQLSVRFDNGQSTSQRIETRNGSISYIDGGITSLQTGVPDGFILNGQYSGGAVSKNLSSTHTYVFNDDGSFSLGRLGSVHTETTDGTASSEDRRGGRYFIQGNTLTLRYEDGGTEKAVIGVMNMNGKQSLVINQTHFRLE